jgi:hypothetical protein
LIPTDKVAPAGTPEIWMLSVSDPSVSTRLAAITPAKLIG